MTKGITFRPGRFDISMQDQQTGEKVRVPTDGYVSSDGAWGIHKHDYHGWRVTHLATGFRGGPDFSRLCNARRYAKVMASRPDLWCVDGDKFGCMPKWAAKGPSPERAEVLQAARAAGGVR